MLQTTRCGRKIAVVRPMVSQTSIVPSESALTSSAPVAQDSSPTPLHATYLTESLSTSNTQNSNRAAGVVSSGLASYFTHTTADPTYVVTNPFLPQDASSMLHAMLNHSVPVPTPVLLGGYKEIRTHLRPQPAHTVIDVERTTPQHLTNY